MELNAVYKKASGSESSLSPGLSHHSKDSLVDLYINNSQPSNTAAFRTTSQLAGQKRHPDSEMSGHPMGDSAFLRESASFAKM